MPDEKPTREQRERVEDELDRELEQTFPGSDPLKVTRSSPRTQITPKPHLPDQAGGAMTTSSSLWGPLYESAALTRILSSGSCNCSGIASSGVSAGRLLSRVTSNCECGLPQTPSEETVPTM